MLFCLHWLPCVWGSYAAKPNVNACHVISVCRQVYVCSLSRIISLIYKLVAVSVASLQSTSVSMALMGIHHKNIGSCMTMKLHVRNWRHVDYCGQFVRVLQSLCYQSTKVPGMYFWSICWTVGINSYHVTSHGDMPYANVVSIMIPSYVKCITIFDILLMPFLIYNPIH